MRQTVKRALAGVAAIAVVGGAGIFAYDYWTAGRFIESTDDAYVKADTTIVAPKVSGYLSDVVVEDNQTVTAGQVLARIDDRDFHTALVQAQADVTAGEAAIANLRAQIDQQQQEIERAQASVEADQAAQTFSRQDFQRYQDLMRTGFGTVQRAEQAAADIQQKTAALVRDRAGLASARQQVQVLTTSLAKAQAALQHDQAVAQQAELNLSYTTITAPIDGVVGNRSLRVGQYVQAGTELMAVVPLQEVYVVGNFKETQLTYVRKGERAEIKIDTFPDVTIHGRVDSVAPAAGQEFALLPADNATGNFTKVVQRIPVKIVLDRDDAVSGLLRPGMSVEPSIDTKATQLAGGYGPSAVVEHKFANR
jgi:membrane fusion protein (multidrug efflux system)